MNILKFVNVSTLFQKFTLDGKVPAHKAMLVIAFQHLGLSKEEVQDVDCIILPEITKSCAEKFLEELYLTSQTMTLKELLVTEKQDKLPLPVTLPDMIDEDEDLVDECGSEEDESNNVEEDLFNYGLPSIKDYDITSFLMDSSLSTREFEFDQTPKHTCPHCSFSSHSMQNVKTHIEVKHEGKRYYCEKCDYSAPYISGLKRHVKRVHEGITYKCDFCEHRASTTFNLKVHVEAKHFGIKYPCDMCDFKASQRGSLKLHKERRHGKIN